MVSDQFREMGTGKTAAGTEPEELTAQEKPSGLDRINARIKAATEYAETAGTKLGDDMTPSARRVIDGLLGQAIDELRAVRAEVKKL